MHYCPACAFSIQDDSSRHCTACGYSQASACADIARNAGMTYANQFRGLPSTPAPMGQSFLPNLGNPNAFGGPAGLHLGQVNPYYGQTVPVPQTPTAPFVGPSHVEQYPPADTRHGPDMPSTRRHRGKKNSRARDSGEYYAPAPPTPAASREFVRAMPTPQITETSRPGLYRPTSVARNRSAAHSIMDAAEAEAVRRQQMLMPRFATPSNPTTRPMRLGSGRPIDLSAETKKLDDKVVSVPPKTDTTPKGDSTESVGEKPAIVRPIPILRPIPQRVAVESNSEKSVIMPAFPVKATKEVKPVTVDVGSQKSKSDGDAHLPVPPLPPPATATATAIPDTSHDSSHPGYDVLEAMGRPHAFPELHKRVTAVESVPSKSLMPATKPKKQTVATKPGIMNQAKRPVPPCSRENRLVWPYDFDPIKTYEIGTWRLKQVPVTTPCGKCQTYHPEEFCELVTECLEIWIPKASGGFCEAQKCQYREGHATSECGLGEWRDHPENPALPESFAWAHRPWNRQSRWRPMPRYYYTGNKAHLPSPRAPLLPERFHEGFGLGLWDKSRPFMYSFESVVAINSNRPKPKWDPSNKDKYPADKVVLKDYSMFPRAKEREDEQNPTGNWFRNLRIHNLPKTGLALNGTEWFDAKFEDAMKSHLDDAARSAIAKTKELYDSAFASYCGAHSMASRKQVMDYISKGIDIYEPFVAKVTQVTKTVKTLSHRSRNQAALSTLVREKGDKDQPSAQINRHEKTSPIKAKPTMAPRVPTQSLTRSFRLESKCGFEPHELVDLDTWDNLDEDEAALEGKELTSDDRCHPSIFPKTDREAATHLEEWIAYTKETVATHKVRAYDRWTSSEYDIMPQISWSMTTKGGKSDKQMVHDHLGRRFKNYSDLVKELCARLLDLAEKAETHSQDRYQGA